MDFENIDDHFSLLVLACELSSGRDDHSSYA
uniref:Uncharacterized protein n=1 Tax=mine drainage metagenome TaxID=410659 RepID=E6PPZ4_9ZZZZ